jgi:GNAT superfamily N-acetyltransferase
MESPLSHTIIFKEKPEDADVYAIAAPLQQFNNENGPQAKYSSMVLQVLDGDGKVTGGLFGKIAYEWMHIEFLVVPESSRGQGIGQALMRQAESIALERGCTGIYLDTLEFQARGFYEKLGYTVFGKLDDFPKGGAHYFLSKRLSSTPSASAAQGIVP